MATYDQAGRLVPELHGLGAADTRSIGASIWEFFHPGQVQDEYTAVGKPAPSTSEIRDAALQDLTTATREAAAQAGSTAFSVVKWLVVGVLALAVIEVAAKVPSHRSEVRSNPRRRRRRSRARR